MYALTGNRKPTLSPQYQGDTMSDPEKLDESAWYVVHTKPRQEFRALEQLENQSYTCFLPTLEVKKSFRSRQEIRIEPLFARYMFVRTNPAVSSITPILSTRGVSKLVAFGGHFATLPDSFIESLRDVRQVTPATFSRGERVTVKDGPFAGLEGLYQIPDGEMRAVILIELMSRPQKLSFELEMLGRAA
jgi:transcriptional antiterminator RfaH